MKKKIIGFMAMLCMMMSVAVCANAAEIVDSGTCGEQGDNLKWTFNSDGTLTISGTGKMCDYSNSIDSAAPSVPWSNHRSEITKLILENGIEDIGNYAFYDCDRITNVTIPNSVKTIGYGAFDDCDGITSVTIPDSVNSIDRSAFSGCGNLINVTIGAGVTSMGGSGCENIFGSCEKLANITVSPENENYISVDGVLFNKDQTTLIRYPSRKTNTEYSIPSGVTTIADLAFDDAVNLTKVYIPQSIEGLEGTFMGCTGLTDIQIPDSVSYINSAFCYCTNLSRVMIGKGVKYVDAGNFDGCEKLENIIVDVGNPYYTSIDGNLFDISKKKLIKYAGGKPDRIYNVPNGITSIGINCFDGCNNLVSIGIGENVTDISTWAFDNCGGLENISVNSENENYSSLDGVLFNLSQNELVRYPEGKKGASYTVPESVTAIGNYAFNRCINLKTFTIPNKMTRIENGTFSGCTGLESVVIPNSIKTIYDYAFNNCDNIKDIYFLGDKSEWDSLIRTMLFNNHSKGNGILITSGVTIYYGVMPTIAPNPITPTPTPISTPKPTPTPNPDVVETSPDTYTISEITPTETGVSVSVQTNKTVSGKQEVILMLYDKNGVFTGLKTQKISASDEAQTVNFEIDKTTISSVKAFIWNDLSYMMPAGNVAKFDL